MAFSLSSFMTAIIMLLVMLAIFFNAMDQMIIISDGSVQITVLDLWCVTFVAAYIYHFIGWLQTRKKKLTEG